MVGKTKLIIGSTDGVDRDVDTRLAANCANGLMHGGDEARAKTLADEIHGQGRAAPIFYAADLSSLAGTRQLARLPTTSGSTFSSAMPESGRARSGPKDAPAPTDTNCGLL